MMIERRPFFRVRFLPSVPETNSEMQVFSLRFLKFNETSICKANSASMHTTYFNGSLRFQRKLIPLNPSIAGVNSFWKVLQKLPLLCSIYVHQMLQGLLAWFTKMMHIFGKHLYLWTLLFSLLSVVDIIIRLPFVEIMIPLIWSFICTHAQCSLKLATSWWQFFKFFAVEMQLRFNMRSGS